MNKLKACFEKVKKIVFNLKLFSSLKIICHQFMSFQWIIYFLILMNLSKDIKLWQCFCSCLFGGKKYSIKTNSSLYVECITIAEVFDRTWENCGQNILFLSNQKSFSFGCFQNNRTEEQHSIYYNLNKLILIETIFHILQYLSNFIIR